MAGKGAVEVGLRIVVEQPVVGVAYSLQGRDDGPLDPRTSPDGRPLVFDFQVRVAPGPKVSGELVRREGAVRRFVYLRVGKLAGDPASPWSRRMKIDVHDIDPEMLDRAAEAGRVVETTVIGTARDGTPAGATVRPTGRRLVDR